MKNPQSLRFSVIAILVLLAGSIIATPPATAFPLIAIRGHVSDALSRPIEDVQVVNLVTGRGSLTGEEGDYTLEEDYIGVYDLLASRGGFNSQLRTVLITEVLLDEIDFVLMYTLTAAVSPKHFVNSGDSTITITAETSLLVPPDCVVFSDISSGDDISLTKTSLDGEYPSKWSGQYAVPSDRASGTYTWSVRVTDCDETTLSTTIEGTYAIE